MTNVPNFDTLLEKRQLKKDRAVYPYENFYKKIRRTHATLRYTELARSSGIKSESRKQFVIAQVTAFEVYLTDLVVELVDSLNTPTEELLQQLSQIKYSLYEVDKIIKNKITIGELICQSSNFQNLDEIGRILTKLFKKQLADEHFFEFIKTRKFHYTNKEGVVIVIFLRKNFYPILKRILKFRHQFVHDIYFGNTPTYKELMMYRKTIISFTLCIDVLADQIRGGTSSKITKK